MDLFITLNYGNIHFVIDPESLRICDGKLIFCNSSENVIYNMEKIESITISEKTFIPWKDETGKLHLVRNDGCVVCKHCTDIFLDPLEGNKIYMTLCEFGMEPSMNCEKIRKRIKTLDTL